MSVKTLHRVIYVASKAIMTWVANINAPGSVCWYIWCRRQKVRDGHHQPALNRIASCCLLMHLLIAHLDNGLTVDTALAYYPLTVPELCWSGVKAVQWSKLIIVASTSNILLQTLLYFRIKLNRQLSNKSSNHYEMRLSVLSRQQWRQWRHVHKLFGANLSDET